MRILIDADGCPVTDLSIKIAGRYRLRCILVCDTAHRFERAGAETVTVSKGPDSADFVLVNLLSPGDIVVTQDYGLAAMALSRGAWPIRQDGMWYDANNIGPLLESRHMAKKVRRAGGRLKGPPKRTPLEDTAFESGLCRLIERELLDHSR